MREIDFMEIGGFQVGQAEDEKGITGITVMLMDKQSPTGLDIRGGGPASRETPLLNSVADCKGLHCIRRRLCVCFGCCRRRDAVS